MYTGNAKGLIHITAAPLVFHTSVYIITKCLRLDRGKNLLLHSSTACRSLWHERHASIVVNRIIFFGGPVMSRSHDSGGTNWR